MVCKYCGASLEDEATTCPVCGKSLVDEPQQSEPAEEVSAPVAEEIAPVATEEVAAQPAPSGKSKLLSLIGTISAFLAIVLSFGLLFASGIASKAGGDSILVSSFLDFSKDGMIPTLVDLITRLGKSGIDPSFFFGTMLTVVVVLATVVGMLVQLIKGIIRFVPAIKGGDNKELGKVAVDTFGAYLSGMLFLLFVNGASGIVLNGGAIAGLCLAGVCVGAYLATRVLLKGLNKGALVPLCLTAGLLVVGAVIAALAAEPAFRSGKTAIGAIYMLIGVMSGNVEIIPSAMLSFISGIVLISVGLGLVKNAMLSVGGLVDEEEVETAGKKARKAKKKGGLGSAICALIFAVLLTVAVLIYRTELVVPIVIVVFAIAAIVLKVVGKKFDKKREAAPVEPQE